MGQLAMGQQGRAFSAAAACLTDVERTRSTVKGRYDGVPLTFSLVGSGWEFTTNLPKGSYALWVQPGGGLPTDAVELDGSEPMARELLGVHVVPPELGSVLRVETIEPALRALGPEIAALDGRLSIRKVYNYYYAEPADIATGCRLAVSLHNAIVASIQTLFTKEETTALVATSHPYRAEAPLVRQVVELQNDIHAKEVRTIARRRRLRRPEVCAAVVLIVFLLELLLVAIALRL